MATRKRLIFLVDDDVEICNVIERTLENALNVNVISFTEGHKCLESIQKEPCDLLISNTSTVGMDGIDLLRKTKRMFPPLPVMIISDVPDVDIAVKAMKLGAFEFCLKPFARSVFLAMVENALSFSSDLRTSNLRALTSTEQIVLRLILESKSTKQIARIRNRSARTIEDQRCAIMHKLGVGNIVDLVKHVELVHFHYFLKDE